MVSAVHDRLHIVTKTDGNSVALWPLRSWGSHGRMSAATTRRRDNRSGNSPTRRKIPKPCRSRFGTRTALPARGVGNGWLGNQSLELWSPRRRRLWQPRRVTFWHGSVGLRGIRRWRNHNLGLSDKLKIPQNSIFVFFMVISTKKLGSN